MNGSYLICATPRTGSTLLCSMLKSSGVAGHPESYFRKQDEYEWAQKWKILSGKTVKFSDYLEAAITAGKTENGVFAARIMWGTMEELVDNIKTLYPDEAGHDKELLFKVFGKTKFIYLKRLDVVAQAVSLLRAEQTDLWHISDGNEPVTPKQTPQYDFDKIHAFVQEANEHNAAWEDWFHANDIKPYTLIYEELSKNPVRETQQVLMFLNLDLPENTRMEASNKRLADDISREWIERYKEDIETFEKLEKI